MKVNIVPTIIAAGISALLAYALYALCHTEGKELLLAIVGGIGFFLTLAGCFAVRFEGERTSANTAVVAVVFFLLLLIANGIFAFVQFATPALVIINGILLLAFVGTEYAIAKAKQ
ncbi:MAG: hypothetical protein IJ634_06495 [Bacteroidales bacterium]|nr:hypothetical protein [Bacteroidales bacterium]